MDLELQCIVLCTANRDAITEVLLEAAEELRVRLQANGIPFVLEVRDVKRGARYLQILNTGNSEDLSD